MSIDINRCASLRYYLNALWCCGKFKKKTRETIFINPKIYYIYILAYRYKLIDLFFVYLINIYQLPGLF